MLNASPRLLLQLNDLHCGSSVGLLPPDSPNEWGNTIGHGKNYHHRFLWGEWLRMNEWAGAVCGNDPFALLLNGDMTEGTHHKTIEIISQTVEQHAEIARIALQPLADRAAAVFVTLGTECHTKGAEHKLAEKLNARTGVAQEKWLFEIAGTLVDAAHHMPTATRIWTEAAGLGAVNANAPANHARAGHRVPRLYCRAHRHVHGGVFSATTMTVCVGPWQLLSRFGHKVVGDSITMPSAVIYDWRNTPDDSIPAVHSFVAIPPQPDIDRV